MVGEDNEDQGDIAGPVPVPLDAARARVITAGLREAMDDARRTVAVLAARCRRTCERPRPRTDEYG